jgi:hypothetical protein
LGDSINTIRENTESLLETSRDIALEINAEKTKYVIMSRHPNSGQNQIIKIANESFEKVAKFKYVGTTLTNQNGIRDEIKSRLIREILVIIQSKIFCLPISKNLKIKIHKTVVSPVVLYGCETWSLTLVEEYRLRFSENKMLKIFGPKMEEDGSWRKLHSDELHNLHYSPNILRLIKSRRMRWAGHVTRMGDGRNVHRDLVGRPECKRSLGRPRHIWEDNIRLDLREIGVDGENWIRLAQDRVQWRVFVNTVINLRVPYESRIYFDKLSDNQLSK